MKKPLIFLLIIMSSCTTFYYSTLSTNDLQLRKNNSGDFIVENENLKVVYCFFGENAPLKITVFNKSDKPFYIDWHKSALIINDVANSFFGDKIKFDSYNFDYSSFGTAELPNSLSFIPPGSKVEHTPIELANLPFSQYDKSNYTTIKLNEQDRVKVIDFNEDNSPLKLKTYLTIRPDKDGKDEIFQNSFYLSRLMKTGSLHPEDLAEGKDRRGDFFYIRDVKGEGLGVITGVIAISTASVLLDAAVNH